MHNTHKAKNSAERHIDQGVGILDEAKERISDLADDARARGEELIGRAKERSQELLDEAQDQGEVAWNRLQKLIQQHPGKAVGYALVAGAALYAFFSHKRDNR